ncbi:aminoglycoside phosphotransferase family protein [Rhizohabitans arisaemae]|uniref:aminoglycoside phosphotransferase family protein n=1 Tax=Rhizohabitans arisaemae TaxID=2720610 RepID=UPI0024B08D5D|nr:aminoglycoside 3'-phosphotransferase/choline kinase family protein [Rhizohabitans arisaemae]
MSRDTLLPAAVTEEQFLAVHQDEELLRPGVVELVGRLGLRGLGVERFSDGSLPVYAVGDRHVLKLYPDVYRREHFEVESDVLQVVRGRLPIPTPEVERAGEFEGWSYVLMSRLPGESLATAWPGIPERDREGLADVLGETLAALHAVPSPEVGSLGPPDWQGFLRDQREKCVAHHRADGLDEVWLAQIPDFLDSVTLPPSPPVLLHTEVMREHLRVTRGPGGWRLSGLFDFEPAMLGAREYEFVAVGLFVSCGEGNLLRRLMIAYGYDPTDLDEALQRRLLAYTLLHRYSSLDWYLTRLPAPPDPTLGSLAACWWALH